MNLIASYLNLCSNFLLVRYLILYYRCAEMLSNTLTTTDYRRHSLYHIL